MGYKLTGMYIRPNGTEQKIRPSHWTPGVNTVAYWKLDGDLTDEMGSYDGTVTSNASVSYVALPGDSSVKCAEVSSSGWTYGISLSNTICNELLSSNVDFTFGGFINNPSMSNNAEMLYVDCGYNVIITCANRNAGFFTEAGGQGSWFTTANLSSNTWYSMIWSYKNSTKTWSFYVNGSLIGTEIKSQDYNTSSNPNKVYLARINTNTLMSNMVLETNVAWDSTAVQLFHDTFKSLYGIS